MSDYERLKYYEDLLEVSISFIEAVFGRLNEAAATMDPALTLRLLEASSALEKFAKALDTLELPRQPGEALTEYQGATIVACCKQAVNLGEEFAAIAHASLPENEIQALVYPEHRDIGVKHRLESEGAKHLAKYHRVLAPV